MAGIKRYAPCFSVLIAAACARAAAPGAAVTEPPRASATASALAPPSAAPNLPLDATDANARPRACRVVAPDRTEPLHFDWEKTVPRGPSGWISALAASTSGVLVTGADAAKPGSGAAFVAHLDANGRERFRVKLDEPRSTLTPPRSVALAAAATTTGEAYVVAVAGRLDAPAVVALTLVDAGGRVRFTTPLELSGQTDPSLVVEPNGDVIVGGALPSGREFGITKVTRDGNRAWTKAYPLSAASPRLLRFGRGLVLVGSLSGTAEFGDVKLARTETFPYRCSGDQHPCEDRAESLMVAELGPEAEPVRARLLGSPANRLTISGVAVAGERLLVTGEYAGPPVALGHASLCELEPGMPELEQKSGFHELGAGQHCSCRADRRDLFLLSLDPIAEPNWGGTLALGGQKPSLVLDDAGAVRWAAEVWRVGVGSDGGARGNTELELWSLDAGGAVSARRAAAGDLRQMAAGGGAVYLSDGRTIRKAKW